MPLAKPKNKQDTLLARAAALMAKAQDQNIPLKEYAGLLQEYCHLQERFSKTLTISDGYQHQVKELADKLERMTSKVRQLSEMALPICIYCRKVRADGEYWQRLETFLSQNVDIMFAQGVCPECVKSTRTGLSPGGVGPGPGKPAGTRSRRTGQTSAEVREIKELRELTKNLAESSPETAEELGKFVERYAKQTRRFHKTLSISDSFQMQLRDLNMRLELLARTDPLTGLANRWEMAKLLEMERSRADRHGSVFALILADIDHFKAVNDKFGHLAGDRVLRTLAGELRRNMRTEDRCARWGGEEFLILLPETEEQAAKTVAEKLRLLVREKRMSWEGKPIHVSLSLGVGVYSAKMSVDEVIRRADDAMYAAKQSGRDMVKGAGDDQPLPAV